MVGVGVAPNMSSKALQTGAPDFLGRFPYLPRVLWLFLIKDFKFAPLMFVTLGFGSQKASLRAIFHGLEAQNPRAQTLEYKGKLPDLRERLQARLGGS